MIPFAEALKTINPNDKNAIGALAKTYQNTSTPTTVQATQVVSNPQALQTPTIPPPTSGSSNNAFIESNNASVVTSQQDALKEQKDNLNQTGNEIATLIQGLGQEGQIKDSVYKKQGVDDAKQQVDELTSQIEAEQLSARRQVEDLKANFKGNTAGLAQAVNASQARSFQKQADMAIVQSAALRRYDTASAIADRQVQAILEPMKARLDALKFIYQENKEAFNKADDRAYQEKIKQEGRQYNKAEQTLNDVKNVKLEAAKNGAPISVLAKIGQATDLDQALQAAGQYGTDPLDRAIKKAQLANLNAPKATDTKVVKINGQDYIQNADGSFSKPKLPEGDQSVQEKKTIEGKIANIDNLLSSSGLPVVVGPNIFSRGGIGAIESFTGATSNFKAGVQQLTSELTLDKLIAAKGAGATFGALSEGELNLLSSANKISSWAVKDKNGKVKYYDASEKDFKTELNKIKENLQATVNTNTDNYLNNLDSALQDPSMLYLQAGYNVSPQINVPK